MIQSLKIPFEFSKLWSWWESNPRPNTAFIVPSTCLVILLIVGNKSGDNVQDYSLSTKFSSQMPLSSSLLHSGRVDVYGLLGKRMFVSAE